MDDSINKKITDEVWDFPNYVCETIERITKKIILSMTQKASRTSR